MDNNYAEQTIRPFTLGRKNFELLLSENDTDLRFIDDLMPRSPSFQRECPSNLKLSMYNNPMYRLNPCENAGGSLNTYTHV